MTVSDGGAKKGPARQPGLPCRRIGIFVDCPLPESRSSRRAVETAMMPERRLKAGMAWHEIGEFKRGMAWLVLTTSS